MKTIALIAHDKKKNEMLEFVGHHKDLLAKFHLVATHTTGTLISDTFGLNVETMMSGPLGGDQQIGAMGTGRRVQGHSFPMRPLGETTSQNSGSKRDMVSLTGLLRKMHPGIPTRNGTHFPSRGPMGNRVPP